MSNKGLSFKDVNNKTKVTNNPKKKRNTSVIRKY